MPTNPTQNLGLTIPNHNDPGATWEAEIDNDLQIIDSAVGANTVAIAAETTARTAADSTFTTNLAAETTARTNADAAEVTARTNADSTLTTNLASEVARATTAEALAEKTANKGVANGYPSLDATGKIPTSQIPALSYDASGAAATVQTALTTETTNRTNADALLLPITTAASTYAPLASPTFTGTLAATGLITVTSGVSNGGNHSFNSTTGTLKFFGGSSYDTGISRTNVGQVAVGNGTAGDTSGSVRANTFSASVSGLLNWWSGSSFDTGLSRSAAAWVAVGNGTAGDSSGNMVANLYSGKVIQLNNAASSVIQFYSGSAYDAGLSRTAAGTVSVGNGTAGDATGTLQAATVYGVNTVKSQVLSLNSPTANIMWWGGSSNDTGLSRGAAGQVNVGNGTSGDTSGTVSAAQYRQSGAYNKLAPAFSDSTGVTGMSVNTNGAYFSANNGSIFSFNAGGLILTNTKPFGWAPGAADLANSDTAFSRVSQGVVALGNGTAGDYSGKLQLSNLYAAAALGSELCPSIITANWTVSNMTVTTNSIAHTTGTVASASPTTPIVPTVGTLYKVVVTITGGGSKYTSVSLGGSQGVMLTAGTYTWFMLASNTSNLVIQNLVVGDPSYTITAVSIKALTSGTGGLTVDGATQLNGAVTLGSLGVGTLGATPTAPLQVVDINSNGIQVTRNAQSSQYLAINEGNGSQHYIGGYGGDKPFIINNQDGTNLLTSGIQLQTNGVTRWLVQSNNGHLIAGADNTYDIGTTGANRPRNLYVAGKVKEYNGVATAGNGVAGVVAAVSLTGQTAAIGNTPLFTPSVTGVFRCTLVLYPTVVGTAGTFTANAVFNNGYAGMAFTSGACSLTTLNAMITQTWVFHCVAGQPIQYSTALSGVTGSPQYGLDVIVEQLA